MKILITGAKGFVGKNLVAELRQHSDIEPFEYDVDTDPKLLDTYCAQADFVFHLAGVNRPQNPEEFMQGNYGFTSSLLDALKKHCNKAPLLITSSIQAALDNPYGQSKKAGEELLLTYGMETGAKVLIYRLPNLFGKWCHPNYNSVVATFCYNIAHNMPIQVNNRDAVLSLLYIDDLLKVFFAALQGNEVRDGDYCVAEPIHPITLGNLADLLYSFKDGRQTLEVPNFANPLEKKLYSTYLSYLPVDGFSYPVKMNIDQRGSFTEIIRTPERGQFSVNIIKSGITKGNHWHHTKNEKFLVVQGEGIIRFRHIATDETVEYRVSGENMKAVDIPPGYTHNIENLGHGDMVVFMWCNECFDPANPDTIFEKV